MLRSATGDGSLVKLTLGKYRGSDSTLRNLYVRPVQLNAGPRFSLLWRHATQDVTKNHTIGEALRLIESLVGGDFLDAHLYTADRVAQLECEPGGAARLRVRTPQGAKPVADFVRNRPHSNECGYGSSHDEPKHYLVPPGAPWLSALGVTNDDGRPREGMAPKFRQIEKFAELLEGLVADALPPQEPLRVLDMGCGKGYLTFAVAALFGGRAKVRGVEVRPELVEFANRTAVEEGFAPRLEFVCGSIADAPWGFSDPAGSRPPNALIALHACDTATDDALARGIAAEAALLVVAPCCQKELRPQLAAPEVLAGALRHGIFRERQAEFATDALRAQLLEWAGYRTKVFEFVSTEHTAKNLMIAAVRGGPAKDPGTAVQIRSFAAFFGIRTHRLAQHLNFALTPTAEG